MKITYFTTLARLERRAWTLKEEPHAPINTWEKYNAYRNSIVKKLLEEIEFPLTDEVIQLVHSIVYHGVDSSMNNWSIADYFNNQEQSLLIPLFSIFGLRIRGFFFTFKNKQKSTNYIIFKYNPIPYFYLQFFLLHLNIT